MPKFLKRSLIILIAIVAIGFIIKYTLRTNTKKHSPEQTITHTSKQATYSVFYNRPYKKGREIFGHLVPFGQVWRTGANEATTFTTDKDILIDGTELKSGTYSLWTIPNKDSWKIIFNNKKYSWGVHFTNGKASRDPKYDALTIEVPAHPLLNEVEQFSIYFEEANDFSILYLAWDKTVVAIPIKLNHPLSK